MVSNITTFIIVLCDRVYTYAVVLRGMTSYVIYSLVVTKWWVYFFLRFLVLSLIHIYCCGLGGVQESTSPCQSRFNFHLNLPMLRLLSSKSQERSLFENDLKTLSCWYSLEYLGILRCVPMCQGFSHFSGSCIILLPKLTTSSKRVKTKDVDELIL